MAKPKPLEKYRAEMQTLKDDIDFAEEEGRDCEKEKEKFHRTAGTIVSKFVSFLVEVANNEQKPWTPELDALGLNTLPMPLKKDNGGFDQVGDYIFRYKAGDSPVRYGRDVVDRKTTEDLTGTLMDSDQRARFYREFDRFRADPRFQGGDFRVFVEGSKADFLNYKAPVPKVCKCCNHCTKQGRGAKAKYWCFQSGRPDPDMEVEALATCEHFRKIIRTEEEAKRDAELTENRRRATIESLEAKGIHVCFQGSREEATKAYKDALRQWAIHNISEVLELKSMKQKVFEEMDAAGFEEAYQKPGTYVLEELLPGWAMYVEVSESGKAGDVWVFDGDEEIALEDVPHAVHKKVREVLEEVGL